jgi:hypothetical protein
VDNMHIFHPMFLFFFGGEISQNFDLKNMISTYSKDFPWKKKAKFARFLNKKVSRSPGFYDEFQYVAQNIEGSCLFF